MLDNREVESNVDSFSGNLFAVLVYFLEVKEAGFGVLFAVFAKCTGKITIAFFYSFFKHMLDSPMYKKFEFSSEKDHLWTMFCLSCNGIYLSGADG